MKVGDYVRTEDGIKKVLKYTYNEKYENGHCVWFDNKDCGTLFTDEEVNKMKPSPNIIDLIEIGDYVNGSKVLDIAQAPKKAIYTEQENGGALLPIVNDRIESVLTKEQFEAMKYKTWRKKNE